jgi:serine/threonine-protein kinase RsbW
MDRYHAMNATRVSYTLESSLASVNKAEQTAGEVAARSGFEEEDCGRIAMAVREAAVNAVLHGNRYDPAKRLTISFETTPDALTVAVRDEGVGLDPAIIPDPLAPENLLKQSGRGIFLIRAFMDEVRFRDLTPGTEITMIKFVRGAGRDVHKEQRQ